MTEDLLAFVTVIAIWKIVQVVMLRSKVKRLEGQKAAVNRELNQLYCQVDKVDKQLAKVKETLCKYVNYCGPRAFVGDGTDEPVPFSDDKEWPAEIE